MTPEPEGAGSGQVFFVVQQRVRPGCAEDYERWLTRIIPVAASFPGHLGTQVVQPPKGRRDYVIVVRFASSDEAALWEKSDARRGLVAEIQTWLETAETIDVKSGIDYWLTVPDSVGSPPRWKQWLVTTLVIWPLTILIPLALKPIFALAPVAIHPFIQGGLVVMSIVGLVVYVVMPNVVRILSPWFFK